MDATHLKETVTREAHELLDTALYHYHPALHTDRTSYGDKDVADAVRAVIDHARRISVGDCCKDRT